MSTDYTALDAAADEARRHLHPVIDPVIDPVFGHGKRSRGSDGLPYVRFERHGTAEDVEALAPIWRRRLEVAGVYLGIVVTSTMVGAPDASQSVCAFFEENDLAKLCACDPEAGVSCTPAVDTGPREQESDEEERTRWA